MKTKKTILIIIIAALIVAVLNYLSAGNNVWRYFHYYLIYSTVFALVNQIYFFKIGKTLNWKKNPEKTLIVSILGSIPLNASIYFLLNLTFKVGIDGQDFNYFIHHQNVFTYVFVTMFTLIISLIIMTTYFFKNIREKQLKTEQLKTQNEQIRFHSLKTQLDPHFLFNNLNVLAGLIEEDPKKAEQFTLQLSDIYKYVLENKDKNTVSVKQEIDFARKYLSLLQMRFEDQLQFSIVGIPDEKAQIPPLSLQTLLENCIKHNAIDQEKPLKIEIKINPDSLIVSNNKNIRPPQQNTSQTGLQNLNNRYRLLNEKEIEIRNKSDIFTVKIPLIYKK
jgi:hypothetical protein